MGWESSGVVGFDLGPLLEGQMRTAKLKSAYNLLIIGPRGFGALSLRWIQFASVFRCARSSWFLAMKSEEGNKATFSHWPRLDTLFAAQAWISLRRLPEAKASKKAVLRVRCLRSMSFIGSKVLL